MANQVDNTVSVIDASRCNAEVTFGCRNRPPAANVPAAGGIAVDETVHTAYVTNQAENKVAMIDTHRCNAFHSAGCRRTPATVAVGDAPVAIAVDKTTHTAYVANATGEDTGSVSVLDTRTCNADPSGCRTTATLQVTAGDPTSIAVNAATNTIYVGTETSEGSNGVSVFNGTTCNASTTTGCSQSAALMTAGPTLGRSEACGGYHVGVAVNEATNTVYATNTEGCGGQGETVYVYDGATCGATNTSGCGAAIATVTAGFNPYELAVDQTTNTIYAPLLSNGEFAGSLAVINGATCNGSNTSGCGQTPSVAPAGFGSIGVAVDRTTHDVYVANVEDTSVSVIRGKKCNGDHTNGCSQPPSFISVDDYPSSVAVDPAVGTAYVTSGTKGTVSVVWLNRKR